MAMLISKFHKLIQSRLLWAVFLVIVIFTFVIWGTSVPDTQEAADQAAPGELNGEPVDAKVFRQAYFNTYLTVLMSVGQPINITPEIDASLREAAWKRIVTLDEARRMGITATDDEVAAAIQSHEGFTTEGQFNKQVYKAFVQQFLGRMGFTERQFEEHVREEILLQKARLMIDRTTLVTPAETRRAFSAVSDKFTVEFVAMKPELVETNVTIGKTEARALFDKDPSAFMIPERVTVRYVALPIAPFIPRATVTEDEVRAYYDENPREFAKEESTNDVEMADDTNLLFQAETETKPFEEVRQDISNKLIQQAARNLAVDKAMNLVVALTPDRDGTALSFEDAAKKNNLEIQTVGPFAAREPVEAVADAGPAFNRAAFELTEGSEGYFSNPVEGSNTIYVLALSERQEPRVPTFDEVADDVIPVARRQAIVDALSSFASKVRDATDKAIREGGSFSNAVAEFGLTVEPTREFSSASGVREGEPYAEDLLRGVLMRNKGELSELLPTEGAILLAYVAERVPGDPATFDSIRGQLVQTIRRQYGRMSFDQWQADLLRKANFKERQPLSGEDEEFVDEDAPVSDESMPTDEAETTAAEAAPESPAADEPAR